MKKLIVPAILALLTAAMIVLGALVLSAHTTHEVGGGMPWATPGDAGTVPISNGPGATPTWGPVSAAAVVVDGGVVQVIQSGSVTLGADGGPTCAAVALPLAPAGGDASTYVGLCNVDIIVQEIGVGVGGQAWCGARINIVGFNEAGVINGGITSNGYGNANGQAWSAASHLFNTDAGCGDAGPIFSGGAGGLGQISTCYPPGIDAGHFDLTITSVTTCNN